MSDSIPRPRDVDRLNRRAQLQANGGTRTSIGFIPYLRNPDTGIRMPIMIRLGTHRLPDPRIVDDVSFWALPGGGVYVSRAPVTIA